MEHDTDRLRTIFMAESEEGLQAMEHALIALERQPADHESLGAVFRVVHTLKGGAAALGYDSLGGFAHLVEDALSLFRDGAVEVTPVRITLLLQITDALRSMLHVAADGRVMQVRASDRLLVSRLLPPELQPALQGGAEGALDGPVQDDEPMSARESEAAADAAVRGEAQRAASRARSLRIDMPKLDALLDLTGEVAVARSRYMQLLQAPGAARDDQLVMHGEELDRLLEELQERVMGLRLVPLGPTFRQHDRTVRDVAATKGKLARLVIEGADVEVDAAVVELLRDPLTHLIRNACDHGLEYPAGRHAAGKDPCGTISLNAWHERGTVVVELSDDGSGLDRERILQVARARGLVGDSEVLADGDVFRLITAPGVSTADRVTDLSGRGVGLDVVRRNVEALRGSISIASTPGAGTTFRLRLPLTLAIIQGLSVAVGDSTFVIPLDAVTECLDFPITERRLARPSGILNVRGEPLGYLRLHDRLQVRGIEGIRQNVVVVHDGSAQAGLVVDAVLGEVQAVIKPLGELFQHLDGISGSTVLGDGRVALILDVASLLAEAHTLAAVQAPELSTATLRSGRPK